MTTPDMHAALARLVNNEQTRKQEKIDQSLPKRSSREAELSPRGAAPRLVKRQFGWLWGYKTRRRAQQRLICDRAMRKATLIKISRRGERLVGEGDCPVQQSLDAKTRAQIRSVRTS